MAEFDDKTNGNTVDATEYNSVVREIKNSILDSDQTLNGSDDHQVAKGMANYAAISTFYTDSGSANIYTLASQTNFNAPTALKNGLTVRFRPTNNNTGASTIQLPGTAAKPAKKADKITDVGAGDISTAFDAEFRYDSVADVWVQNVSNATTATTSAKGVSLLPAQITISNNTSDANNDIDFATGTFQFSDGSGQATLSALTKRLDASWVVGTNQGGLFSGSKANSTWYHCFAIYNPTTGVSDAGFDTSITAANIPSGYTKYKRVGSIRTDGSGNILAFTQYANHFVWSVMTKDADASTSSTASNITLTTPLGVKTVADVNLRVGFTGSGGASAIITSLDQANTVPDNATFSHADSGSVDAYVGFSDRRVATNTSSQIRIRFSSNVAGYRLWTNGWIDYQL